jgi:integrase
MGKRGDGYLYRRGVWWWIKYYVDGVPQRESARTTDEREARAVLRQRLVEVRQGVHSWRLDRLHVDSLLDDLLADYELHNPKSLEDFAVPYVKKHLRPFFGKLRVPQVTTDLLRHYQIRKRAQGLSDATVNRTMALLRRSFHLGAEATPRKVVVIPKFPMFTENNVRTGFLEHEQYRSLLVELPAELQPLFVVGYHVGNRCGELLALKWAQVDLTVRQIRLRRGETKNDEGRVLPIYGDMVTVLELAKEQRDREFPRCPWVFHRLGRHILNFRKSWESACRRANLGKLQFHDLRRSAIRNLVRAGVPERVAMQISGHKTRAVFDRYNIVSERDIREAGQKMERYLVETGTKTGTIANPDSNQGERIDARKPLN